MKVIKVSTAKQYLKIYGLYQYSFPVREKKPFFSIVKRNKNGKMDMWYIEENGNFIGLAITMKWKDMVLLDYFAINKNLRSNGYGSKSLRMLQKYYEGRRFLLEIENVYENAHNQKDRERRKKFYLNNNMKSMDMFVHLFGTDMEILGYNCMVSYEEYLSIYANIFSIKKASLIKQIQVGVDENGSV